MSWDGRMTFSFRSPQNKLTYFGFGSDLIVVALRAPLSVELRCSVINDADDLIVVSFNYSPVSIKPVKKTKTKSRLSHVSRSTFYVSHLIVSNLIIILID